MMKYFAILFAVAFFLDLAAWNNNYQRNRAVTGNKNGTTYYYDSRGASAGRASVSGNNTYYYDRRGASAGRA